MKKLIYIAATVLVMALTSAIAVRMIDGAVQIDDDIGLLILLLALWNTGIGILSHRLYRKIRKK